MVEVGDLENLSNWNEMRSKHDQRIGNIKTNFVSFLYNLMSKISGRKREQQRMKMNKRILNEITRNLIQF